ncbi:dehydrogenase [Rhizorhabdus wittichii DC-6]|nr:dehydrogenase [Rhizorhabdus wittichii DC-6]
MAHLNDKAAIVTGSASGIGFDLATDLARRGAKVMLCDIADPMAAVARLRDEGLDADGMVADVADPSAFAGVVARCVDRFGRLDILVNNAGLFTTIGRAPFEELDVDEWRRVLDVNVTGPFLCSRAALPQLRAAGGGRIINIGSATVFSAPPNMLHYVASKGALTAMTRSMAREVGKDGITVNLIAPGFTISAGVLEHQAATLGEHGARMRAARAIGRDQMPQDICGAVSFLAGDDAGFITGQTLVVDGGIVMR